MDKYLIPSKNELFIETTRFMQNTDLLTARAKCINESESPDYYNALLDLNYRLERYNYRLQSIIAKRGL